MVGRTVLAMSLALSALAGCGDGDVAGDTTTGSRQPPGPATATSAGTTTARAPETPGIPATVAFVTDGDTIGARTARGLVRVRLLGIDTPEVDTPDGRPECFAREASRKAADLMPVGSKVTLVTDPTQDTRDRFGRLLAYVLPPGGGPPVNETLLREGFATVFVFRRERPFARVEAFRGAEQAARSAGRGLWRACPRG